MDDDRTVPLPVAARPRCEVAPIELAVLSGRGARRSARFTTSFIVGRDEDCAVRIAEEGVSRQHLEVYPEKGVWWARDLQSSNGTLVAGRPIERIPLQGTTTLELGRNGPRIRLVAPPPPAPRPDKPATVARIAEHYFEGDQSEPAGERTLLIRQAFRVTQRRHSSRYRILIGVGALLLAAVGGVAFFLHVQLERTSALANDIFYDMKELELQVMNLEASVDDATAAVLKDQIAESKRKLANMRERYEVFVEKVQARRFIPLDSEAQIILHIARVFGETEVDVPGDFIAEVRSYIKRWQSSSRLVNAIKRLHENDYTGRIVNALTGAGLPPQFIYLALQETNFQARAVGPPTRYGRAKGMWQFIPSTGRRYGLRPGPLEASGVYDPADDRHDVAKATGAAAQYLRDIYRTDAQASGLLVMASYNWGEGNIIKRIRQMPKSPRERNFWALLRKHTIPKETYDYVFYIFSAAVICENPRLFGFDFDNPLAGFQQPL